jgi:DNA-binding PadR family transcriptional regulator/ADP-ribose pyrophosphatase YjhB (NUDIX family)
VAASSARSARPDAPDRGGGRSLTRLVILWLLSETPLHGYRIKQILDDQELRFWFPVEVGSIYSALRTLVGRGYVQPVAVEREGQRPERTRFAITSAGRTHLEELLRTAWRRLPSPAEPICLALAARSDLPEGDVQRALSERMAGLRARLRRLDGLRRSAPAPEMVERQRALTQAELDWAGSVLGDGSPVADVPAAAEREGTVSTLRHPTDVQLIANVVATRSDGRLLLIRYDPQDERWWLPGGDLEPYEHPDGAAARVLGAFPGLLFEPPAMRFVDSFRGRRGWHVVFNYRVNVSGRPRSELPVAWFGRDELPRTMHGRWEHDAVERTLA